MTRLFSFFLLFIILALAACKLDNNGGMNYELEGNWSMYEAYRNNSLTNTLEDGYFNFQDSMLETNIIGSPITGKFRIMNDAFVHESELPVKYDISFYSKDTLHLNTQIQGFKFLFKLQRAIDSIPEE